MKEVFYYEMDGKKHEYNILEDVPCSSLLSAINEAAEMCYDESGVFHPELVQFAKEYVILTYLTDIEMPTTMNEAYKYIRAIDGVRSVDADFISDGVEAKIQYNKEMVLASMQSLGTNRVADQMSDIFEKLNSMLDTTSSLLDGIAQQAENGDFADIGKLAGVIEKLNITPEQLATAMIEANRKTKKRTAKKVEQ